MNVERNAEALARELNEGDTQHAAAILSRSLTENPYETFAIINRARQMESPRGAEDVVVERDGDVKIVSKYNGEPLAFVGRIPMERPRYQPAPPPPYGFAPPHYEVLPPPGGGGVWFNFRFGR